ncbi:halocyanin [Haloarcula halophila]|uniref:halocyanin n=1 Tax=Haloarcula TaxID=2237 RepID=UPI0023E428A1|nr:halocyanin [Halomicroarcula sp. DFY41]
MSALGAAGVAAAQGTGGDASVGGSGLYVTAAALVLTGLAIGAVYLLSWRDRPEPTFAPAKQTEERVPPKRDTGPMYESNVDTGETESVDHDAFDPIGTGTILVIYFLVITLAWLFMYFVEFLDNGPTVVG